jgi:hypothetical protein
MATRWLVKDMSYSLFDTLEHTFDILINGISPGGTSSVQDNPKYTTPGP